MVFASGRMTDRPLGANEQKRRDPAVAGAARPGEVRAGWRRAGRQGPRTGSRQRARGRKGWPRGEMTSGWEAAWHPPTASQVKPSHRESLPGPRPPTRTRGFF